MSGVDVNAHDYARIGRPDETHEDWDDSPVRCIECGLYSSPDDGDYVATSRGSVCIHCAGRSGAEAA